MTVKRLLSEVDSHEIAEWIAFFMIEANQDKEQESKNLTEKFKATIAGWNTKYEKSR